jgi:hypothetical protein
MPKTFLEYVLFKENQEIFSKAILSLMYKRLKSLGYDIRGSADVRAILNRGRVFRDRKFVHQDWKNAYDAAVESIEKNKKNIKIKKRSYAKCRFFCLKKFKKNRKS